MKAKAILEPKFTEHYFEFDNMKYFRENAHSVAMGSYGEKKDPIGARAYLDVHAKVKPEVVANYIKFVTTVDIDWTELSATLIGGSGYLPVFGMDGKAAVSTAFGKAKSANVKLMYFQINEGALLKMLNQDADGARKYLADQGSDGRICSGVWLWAEVQVAEQFASSTTFTASVDSGTAGLSIIAKGGKHGTQTITVTSGTTCAYRLHKVKSWKDRHKTQIDDLETDFKGNG